MIMKNFLVVYFINCPGGGGMLVLHNQVDICTIFQQNYFLVLHMLQITSYHDQLIVITAFMIRKGHCPESHKQKYVPLIKLFLHWYHQYR